MTDGRAVPTPSRRDFLRSGLLALGATAGCLESRSPFAPPVVEDRPDAVYVPSHFEGMELVGTASSGPVSAAVTFSYPHRFWLLSGTERNRVRIRSEDSLHLMVQLWEEESGTVLSGASPSVTVKQDGSVVSERIFWPMLSQQMGFHYGDNISLQGEGSYSIAVLVPESQDALRGGFESALSGPHRFDFTLEWYQTSLDGIPINTVSNERAGTRDSLEPMQGAAGPLGHLTGDLPGTSLGSGVSDEMQVNASVIPRGPEQPELIVTVGTPYNGFAIPMAGPVVVQGETTYRLRAALDPSIGMHYRRTIPAEATGQSMDIRFPTPPQVVRHEGYETAFMESDPVRFTTG